MVAQSFGKADFPIESILTTTPDVPRKMVLSRVVCGLCRAMIDEVGRFEKRIEYFSASDEYVRWTRSGACTEYQTNTGSTFPICGTGKNWGV